MEDILQLIAEKAEVVQKLIAVHDISKVSFEDIIRMCS
jgi:hypothetical protein